MDVEKFCPAGVIVWLTFVADVQLVPQETKHEQVAAAVFSNRVLLKISRTSNVQKDVVLEMVRRFNAPAPEEPPTGKFVVVTRLLSSPHRSVRTTFGFGEILKFGNLVRSKVITDTDRVMFILSEGVIWDTQNGF